MLKDVIQSLRLAGIEKAACLFPFVLLTSGCLSTPSGSRVDVDAVQSENITITDQLPDVELSQIVMNAQMDVFKQGDLAIVTVYNVENLSGTFLVGRDGTINFPLIGTIPVAGLTTLELQSTLIDAYGAEYLQNPSITVLLEATPLGRIVVDGSVNEAGVFDLTRKIPLSEAIALAGGVGENADTDRIFILRRQGETNHLQLVSLNEIRSGVIKEPQLIPGDLIFIEDDRGLVLFREFVRTAPLFNTAAILLTR